MIGLLGRKVGMSQIFDAEGQQVPVTVLEVGPCFVTALRTKEKNGYLGVQLGFGAVQEKRMAKAKAGVCRKAGVPMVLILSLALVLGGMVIGYWSETVFVVLICVALFQLLVSLGVKLYYKVKM